jgi:hypothetical protein
MKLLVINPNSDTAMTAVIRQAAEAYAAGEFQAVCMNTDTLHMGADWCAYEGLSVKGRIEKVIARGELIIILSITAIRDFTPFTIFSWKLGRTWGLGSPCSTTRG